MLSVPKLQAPIVLVHGICGFDRLLNGRRPGKEYFPGVRDDFEAAGNRVLIPRVSPTSSIATRAMELKNFLQREVGSQPVHLIGHSLGGLDSRYLIARLGMENRVKSLTTIGCPHRGSSFVDWGVSRFARYFKPLFRMAGIDDDGIYALLTESCQRFNDETPDVPGVKYFSVAGVIEKPWMDNAWKFPSRIVRKAEGPNDGVVSVASATWGERTTIWQGDHLNLVNWPNKRMHKAGEWPDRAGEYAALLGQLQTVGF